MSIKKIMCCCGQGLGSSFLVEMNVKKALDNLGVSGIEVSHALLSEVYKGVADVFVVGVDVADEVADKGDVIALNNIISLPEVEGKIKDYLTEKGAL